jgi:hypothetical protein
MTILYRSADPGDDGSRSRSLFRAAGDRLEMISSAGRKAFGGLSGARLPASKEFDFGSEFSGALAGASSVAPSDEGREKAASVAAERKTGAFAVPLIEGSVFPSTATTLAGSFAKMTGMDRASSGPAAQTRESDRGGLSAFFERSDSGGIRTPAFAFGRETGGDPAAFFDGARHEITGAGNRARGVSAAMREASGLAAGTATIDVRVDSKRWEEPIKDLVVQIAGQLIRDGYLTRHGD